MTRTPERGDYWVYKEAIKVDLLVKGLGKVWLMAEELIFVQIKKGGFLLKNKLKKPTEKWWIYP